MTHIELYTETVQPALTLDRRTDFRWRMVHTNGNVVGASTEGYADKRDMIWNLKFVTGCRFDRGGTVAKRRYLERTRYTGSRWQEFEVRDLTQGEKS